MGRMTRIAGMATPDDVRRIALSLPELVRAFDAAHRGP